MERDRARSASRGGKTISKPWDSSPPGARHSCRLNVIRVTMQFSMDSCLFPHFAFVASCLISSTPGFLVKKGSHPRKRENRVITGLISVIKREKA